MNLKLDESLIMLSVGQEDKTCLMVETAIRKVPVISATPSAVGEVEGQSAMLVQGI